MFTIQTTQNAAGSIPKFVTARTVNPSSVGDELVRKQVRRSTVIPANVGRTPLKLGSILPCDLLITCEIKSVF
jgi:hypothetical protein